MNYLSIILRITAIIAAIVSGTLFFLSKGKLADEKSSRITVEKMAKETQQQLDLANEEIDGLQKNLKTASQNLSDTKRELDNTRSEMFTARQEVNRTIQQLSIAKNNISNLEQTARNLRSELVIAEQNLSSAINEDEFTRLNDIIAELENSNMSLKESLANAKSRNESRLSEMVENGDTKYTAITFKSSQNKPLNDTPFGPKTTVLSVDNGLVVLANNTELSLVPGTQAKIIKGRQAIASIQVMKADNEMALANILPGAKTRALTAGATVSLLR